MGQESSVLYDETVKYDRKYYWYFYGSSGDLTTWKGVRVVKKKKNKTKRHGLGGTLYD